jgi:hypothetical protein
VKMARSMLEIADRLEEDCLSFGQERLARRELLRSKANRR